MVTVAMEEIGGGNAEVRMERVEFEVEHWASVEVEEAVALGRVASAGGQMAAWMASLEEAEKAAKLEMARVAM